MKLWMQNTYSSVWHMQVLQYWLHGLWVLSGIRWDSKTNALCTKSQVMHSTLCSPGPHNPLHRISWRNQDFHTSDQVLFVFSAHNDNPLSCPCDKLLLILQRPLVSPSSRSLPWLSQVLLVVPTSASAVLGVDIQTCADCIILCWI